MDSDRPAADQTLSTLPSVPLLKMISYLDYKDLVSCSLTCRSLHIQARDDQLWKHQCCKYWKQTECPDACSWREYFVQWYQDFGPYIDVYAAVRKAWDQIEKVVQNECKDIYQSLEEGLSESMLDTLEQDMDVMMPPAMRCAYRIHDGQSTHENAPGLMGTMMIHLHYRSEYLLSLISSCQVTLTNEIHETNGCIPLTYCGLSAYGQEIVLSDKHGLEHGQIIYVHMDSDMEQEDYFVTAPSFLQWFTHYAQQLEDDAFLLMHGHIYRFYKEPSQVVETNYITVEVMTSFVPELSTIQPPKFFYAYRITMSMAADAPAWASCKLETRHWYIVDEEEDVEEVHGPGVVGQFPVMKPGSVFTWTSCTTFATTYGNMRGYFTMSALDSAVSYRVECPVFHMKCLPYITSPQRQERILARKKDL